jgi:class 3 adenylate cyclase
MSTRLPEGTVTFLFTDIEGSTKLVAEVGDAAYGAVLDAERAIVVGAGVAEGGVPFGSEGDAHFVAFDSAGAAIRAAVAAQRALASRTWEHGPVRVRMGDPHRRGAGRGGRLRRPGGPPGGTRGRRGSRRPGARHRRDAAAGR